MQPIDFVGDIHGHASALRALLDRLGYKYQANQWTHPQDGRLVFLGDLIDRGPEQRETVDLVHALCESGRALCLMGNHEFNAVGFVTSRTDDPDRYVRSHTDGHTRQHQAFLDAYQHDSVGYQDTIAWFKTLPLWFEQPGVRAVHACWHAPAQALLAPYLDHRHAPTDLSFFTDSAIEHSAAWQARETLLNGLEMRLPEGSHFKDYYGIQRRRIRLNWWDPDQSTYRDSAVIDVTQRDRIPDLPLPSTAPSYHESLVFFGHYWMRGIPSIRHPRAVCLDYSVALPDGALCAYRYQGEIDAQSDHLVWVSNS